MVTQGLHRRELLRGGAAGLASLIINPFSAITKGSTQPDAQETIIGAFYYPWYRNPSISPETGWKHWQEGGYNPPQTWASFYAPNFPTYEFNANVNLYDSTDFEVLRWQNQAMKRAGINLAIASWWGFGYEDEAFSRAIGECKDVKWCIYYEKEGYGNPSPEEIHNDIKHVIDKYSPTNNYAKINDKWLVFVYKVWDEDSSNRWRQAKSMLKDSGYDIYLNGGGAELSENHPWDSVHRYNPKAHFRTFAFLNVDNSASISPGFAKVPNNYPDPNDHSLEIFISSLSQAKTNQEKFRFLLTYWNEWHEGSQIEPGKEIIPDSSGFFPSGYDYGYDFVDALGEAARNFNCESLKFPLNNLPAHLKAGAMIHSPLDVKPTGRNNLERKIITSRARIGTFFTASEKSDLIINARANPKLDVSSRFNKFPEIEIYLDDELISKQQAIKEGYQNFPVLIEESKVNKGRHKVEIAFKQEPKKGKWNLILNYIDVCKPEDADMSGDRFTDLRDFSQMGLAWRSNEGTDSFQALCDMNGDGTIDHLDLKRLCHKWLRP
jgi:hypothetical protein